MTNWYTQHPRQRIIIWSVFYVVLIVAFIIGIYRFTSRISTSILPSGQIDLELTHSKYVVGEAVEFTVVNKLNTAIYFTNKCPTEPLDVYRLENNAWVRLHETTTIANCHGEDRQIMVPAMGTASASFAAWPHLFDRAGKYRIVAVVQNYSLLPYRDFEITEKVDKKPAPKSVPSTQTRPTNNTQPQTTPVITPPRDNGREPGDD